MAQRNDAIEYSASLGTCLAIGVHERGTRSNAIHYRQRTTIDPLRQSHESLVNPILGIGYKNESHTSHPEIIKRLKRAEGHLRSIVSMLEEGRDCLAIAQQMQAVEGANAKKALIHNHSDQCLNQAVRDAARTPEETIREFKELTKYL